MTINLQDLSGTFAPFDVIASAGVVPGAVHDSSAGSTATPTRTSSYSQSIVQTLVLVGMVVR